METLLYPVLAQVALTFLLLFAMGRARVGSLSSGRVKMADIATNAGAFPDDVRKVSNCYMNQFETPLLFYAAMAFAMATQTVTAPIIALAWAWVASRYVHAGIFATSNNVRLRFYAFLTGVAILLALWVFLSLAILGS